jgi:hypothetical protein
MEEHRPPAAAGHVAMVIGRGPAHHGADRPEASSGVSPPRLPSRTKHHAPPAHQHSGSRR